MENTYKLGLAAIAASVALVGCGGESSSGGGGGPASIFFSFHLSEGGMHRRL